ncbi:MAG: LLM class F420-dependent oxidoreductase [Acidimicrobiia bacterium]
MRFSITHPLLSHPADPGFVDGATIATMARAAEKAGFDGYGFTDHPAPSQRWLDAGGHETLDPFVALGFVAGATTTIRLIPNIAVLPYRNPFLVAKAAATVDVLSGGRFTLAAGAGYLKSEFAALGVDPAERNDLFDEAVQVLVSVWTSDDVTFEGRHFRARGISGHPRPVSDPHPPIWIGGNSAAARQRVVDLGDGWCPFPAPAPLARTARTTALDTPERLAAAIDDLRERLDRAGRDAASIDISFANAAGGTPWSHDFSPEAHLAGLEDLAHLGVTWVQVGLPGSSPAAALDAIARYGETVIGPHRG